MRGRGVGSESQTCVNVDSRSKSVSPTKRARLGGGFSQTIRIGISRIFVDMVCIGTYQSLGIGQRF